MTIFFVTSGAWGSGTGSPLSAAQVDGNFYDVDQRIDGLTTDVAEGKRIDFVTYNDTSFTFHYTDATTQTIPLPVAQLQFVGPWMNSTPMIRGDLFTSGNGFYQVLEDHTTPASPTEFDPDATDGSTANNPLYQLWMPLYDTLNSLTDVEINSAIAEGDIIVWNGTTWINEAPGVPTFELNDLTDVIIDTGVTNGDILSFDGTNWINSSQIFDPAVNDLGNLSGSASLNLSDTDLIKFGVSGNLTITGFTWPTGSSGDFVRRTVQITNTGTFTLTWPGASKWPGGVKPVLSSGSGKIDTYVLYTLDGGTTVFGSVVGQNYA